jgi:hypothetical protein
MPRMARKNNTEIRRLVDDFVAQLTEIVHESALDMVREALGDTPAPRKRGPGRPPKATAAKPGRKRKARARRTAGEVEALGKVVLDYVRANAGQRLEEIGRGLKRATKDLKRPIAKLLESGALRTEGQRRGTKYYAAGRKAAAPKKATRKKTKAKRAKRKKTAKRK